ncbi:LysM peptidoglycan-binding domain-containing protein [Peribacillus saganii]|uniref:LysM peptidoglycan-binding domain-containing protein n=1 Tax=Peribacillus saganii TaxID=2303992 RepID=A0A372LJ30_9BACI|nr:3D domain-containing protein [Peribacillus saganii]RFU66373.1 LysM peptidoglycan-binding domain-containing protein [Peribacillus saganii]
MKRSILTFAAAAAFTTAFGANASAQEVKVAEGDSLWKLSEKYQVTVDDIRSWNNLSSDIIHPGDSLKVSAEEYYTIKKGDTLSEIACSYGVTVENLKKWNQLTGDRIFAEKQLLIITEGVYAGPATVGETVAAQHKQQSTAPSQEKQQATAQVKQPASAKPAPAQQNQSATVKPAPAQPKQSAPVREKQAEKSVVRPAAEQPAQSSDSKEIIVKATAYTASCEGCSGVTATGINLKDNPDAKVISVDPNVIPLGSKVYVEGYGNAVAGDTGGAIKGNKIDVFIPNQQDAINWGTKQVTVKVLD